MIVVSFHPSSKDVRLPQTMQRAMAAEAEAAREARAKVTAIFDHRSPYLGWVWSGDRWWRPRES